MKKLKPLILSIVLLTIFNFSFADESLGPPQCIKSSNPDDNIGVCWALPEGEGSACLYCGTGEGMVRCSGTY